MPAFSRTFSRDDQLAFARLSGEHNPIHLDPIAARRLLFGRAVLHGLQLVLWAADQWLAGGTTPVRLKTFRVVYRRPLGIDEPVEAVINSPSADEARFELTADGASLLTAEIACEADLGRGIGIADGIPEQRAPRERSDAELRACAGRISLCLDRAFASQLFPNLVRLIPPEQLASLLATTRLVGMEAPGLHSVCRSLSLSDGAGSGAAELAYRADRYDERFSLLDLRVDGPGLSGTVSTGIRPPPVMQADFAAAQARVAPGEFAGERALIIGGSRGLGEAAAKLLAAGGADVRLTWRRGEADARRVVEQIKAGGGSPTAFHYDVMQGAATLTESLDRWPPTLLCFFATPFMFAGVQGRYSERLYRNFCEVYVAGFESTFRGAGRPARVLYPSSAWIDDPPPTLAEFAAAKSAGESLCRALAGAHPQVRFYVPRFERLATDQTATLLRVAATDPMGPVLEAIRALRTGTG